MDVDVPPVAERRSGRVPHPRLERRDQQAVAGEAALGEQDHRARGKGHAKEIQVTEADRPCCLPTVCTYLIIYVHRCNFS